MGHSRGSNTCLVHHVILQLAVCVKGDTSVLSCRVNAGKEPICRPFDLSQELAFFPPQLEKQYWGPNNEDEFVQFLLGWFRPTDPTEKQPLNKGLMGFKSDQNLACAPRKLAKLNADAKLAKRWANSNWANIVEWKCIEAFGACRRMH